MPPSEKRAFPEDLPEGLQPRLRLFFSVDVVGSVQLKQSQQPWRPSILNFYRDFDHTVYSSYRAVNERSNHVLPTPEFWKSNGDELLYTCEIKNLDQTHDMIQVWLAALSAYRHTVTPDSDRPDVKSTAWIGLFPVPNAEVFFRRGGAQFRSDLLDDPQLLQAELREEWYAKGGRGDITRDFVGPSIDTGFRLTSWATPQRFIISVDLAFLLVSSRQDSAEPALLHLSGRSKLKGVIDDEPYPAIWLPVGGDDKLADVAVGRDLADAEAIGRSCAGIIERHYKFITPLFLSGGASDRFDWAPPYIINEIRNLWSEEQDHKAEAQAATDTTLAYVHGRNLGGASARRRLRVA